MFKRVLKSALVMLLILSSPSVFASKARLKALSNSFHLTDYQSQFTSSYQIFSLKDALSIEAGNQSSTSDSTNATITYNQSLDGNSKLAMSLGRLDETTQPSRKFINSVGSTSFITQQNAINLIYGVKGENADIAVGTYYSNFKDQKNVSRESSSGIKFGIVSGAFKARLNLGLVNSVENTTDGKFDGSSYVNSVLRYSKDNHKWGLDFTQWQARLNNTSGLETQSHEFKNYRLQYAYTTSENQADAFIGVALDSIELKNIQNDKKLNRLAFPVWFGLEKTIDETIVFRSSITQTVLISKSKDENGYASGLVNGAYGTVDSEYEGEPNNTEVAMGMGLKFKDLLIDGTFKGLVSKTQSQSINASDFLTQVAMTYQF